MQVVRHSSLAVTPWKNGGGTTREAIRAPPTGSTFRWRVSIARIDASGPFSDFAGFNRTMVLLQGSDVRLSPRGGEPRVLRAPGDIVEFDGAVPMHCELLNGPCTDLNLMVSTSIAGVRVRVQRLMRLQDLETAEAETTLLLPVSGSVAIGGVGDGALDLNAWDLALVSRGERLSVAPAAAGPAPLVFFATLEDNSH